MRTADLLRPGTVVSLPGCADTAVVIRVLRCCPERGCSRRAYRVRRQPGQFPAWPDDIGLWHAEDTITAGR